MVNQCFMPDAPCSHRKECEKVSRCEYLMLRQAINDVLVIAIEDSEGSHIAEQEMINLRNAFERR